MYPPGYLAWKALKWFLARCSMTYRCRSWVDAVEKCSAVVGFALGGRFPLFLAGRCGLISAVPSGCRDLPADAHQRHPPELDLMPVRLPFALDATPKRRKENP